MDKIKIMWYILGYFLIVCSFVLMNVTASQKETGPKVWFSLLTIVVIIIGLLCFKRVRKIIWN
jgi:hypothetical protein